MCQILLLNKNTRTIQTQKIQPWPSEKGKGKRSDFILLVLNEIQKWKHCDRETDTYHLLASGLDDAQTPVLTFIPE